MSDCYHCGLPNPDDTSYQAEILGQPRVLCCPGCQAVAETIVSSGLEDYYRFRSEKAPQGDEKILNQLNQLDLYDDAQIQQEFVNELSDSQQVQLSIDGINCAACGWLIERQLSKIVGIKQVSVNVSARRALVSWYPEHSKLSHILKHIERIGYHALPFQPDQHEALYQKQHKHFLRQLGLSGLFSMQVMMLAIGQYFDWFGAIDTQTKDYFDWLSLLLTLPIVTYAATGFYRSAYLALAARTVNMDVPISLAIVLTFAASTYATVSGQGQVYFESISMFVFLLLISRYSEHRSRQQATQMSANMHKYVPVSAELLENGQTRTIAAKQVQVGQQVQVKSGQTVPVDGRIISGQGLLEESMLTGEFAPVAKGVGDTVFGGSLNHEGSFVLQVDKPLKQALISQILQMQEQALGNKPRIALLADRLAQYFVFFVLLVAAGSYGFWTSQGNPDALWIAVAVLVATCPCALGLATPSALSCALAHLNRQGILLKRSDALEQLTQIDTLLLDKTGTLTNGRFSIQRIRLAAGQSIPDILSIAAALERHSEHPIAQAFLPFANQQQAREVKIHTGKGIQGKIDQHEYKVGSPAFCQLPALHGNVYLTRNGQLLASFVLSDQLKSEAKPVLQTLPQVQPMHISLLSGDQPQQVKHIAEQLGIKDSHACQQPQDKLAQVQRYQQQGKQVLMLGDGVNDAPVLAAADVSMAVVNASDLAKNAADICLLKQDLNALPLLFTTANRCKRKIQQNLAWALGYNLLVLPLAISGWLTPWMAVVGMSASSILVVSNSSRLLK